MTPGFTEFSYGFALVENLIRRNAHALPGAPVFPNLVQEATLGYDVELSHPISPLFLQFKLPEVMVRTNAKEAQSPTLGYLAPTYFRMPITRRDRSRQHEKLISKEAHFPGRVLYAMACLRESGDFNASFVAGDIPHESVYFSPASMGLLTDDKQHKVIYKAWSSHGWFCSEPREIEARQYKSVEQSLRTGFEQKEFQDPRQVAQLLRDSVVKNVDGPLRETEQQIREAFRARAGRRPDGIAVPSGEQLEVAENLVVAHRLAQVGLGLELVVAQPKP